MKRFWFDVETTGLNYYDNEIVSLAYIMEIDEKIVTHGIIYAKPDRFETVQTKALEVNGFTISQLETFPSQAELLKSVKKLFDQHASIRNHSDRFVTAGFNSAGCDVIFLQQLFTTHGEKDYEYFDYFVSEKIDVFVMLPLIEELCGIKFHSHRLEDIAKVFKLEHKAHDAMSDTIVTWKLYRIFMKRLKEGSRKC